MVSIRRAATSRLGRSVRPNDRLSDGSLEQVAAFEDEWRRGEPPRIEEHWRAQGRLTTLANLIKVDLRARFGRGYRPSAAEYLDRFPRLRDEPERVLSLAYEEFCLLEEAGRRPDPESFCGRYPVWADSLASQIRCHDLLSRAIGRDDPRPIFPKPGDDFAWGKFQLIRPLGRGGAAQVFLAFEPEFHREVALKITADRADDREPAIQGRLDHPRIVPVWSVTRDPQSGLRGLCMPYRDGLPLDEVIGRIDPAGRPRRAEALLRAILPSSMLERRNTLPSGWEDFPARGSYSDAVAWVGLALARALEHAHGRGVVHRDLKPANVLMTVREGPQLLDFNLSDAPNIAEQAQAARSGGTLPYMAPEQLLAFLDEQRWEDVGPPADLYALGLVLHELLTGRRAAMPSHSASLPRAVLEMYDFRAERPPSPRSLNPDVPQALSNIIDRCLEPRPSDRHPSAAALAEDLERFLQRRPLAHASNPPAPVLGVYWARRHRGLIAALILVGATIGMASTGAYQWALDPFMPKADIPAASWVKIGHDFMENGQFTEAYEAFGTALRLNPNQFAALDGMAELAEQIGKEPSEVVSRFERAADVALTLGTTIAPIKAVNLALKHAERGVDLVNENRKAGSVRSLDLETEILSSISRHTRVLLLDRPPSSNALNANPELKNWIVRLGHFGAKAENMLAEIANAADHHEDVKRHCLLAWNYIIHTYYIDPDDPESRDTLKEYATLMLETDWTEVHDQARSLVTELSSGDQPDHP